MVMPIFSGNVQIFFEDDAVLVLSGIKRAPALMPVGISIGARGTKRTTYKGDVPTGIKRAPVLAPVGTSIGARGHQRALILWAEGSEKRAGRGTVTQRIPRTRGCFECFAWAQWVYGQGCVISALAEVERDGGGLCRFGEAVGEAFWFGFGLGG